MKNTEQQSHLRQNELVGIADTTVVNVTGQILDGNTSEVIFYAIAVLRNKTSNKTTQQMVDSLGQFQFVVNPGEYNLKVNCIGYTDLDTTLIFESGETRDLKVALGEAGSFTMYQIKSHKKLTVRELNEAAEELKE